MDIIEKNNLKKLWEKLKIEDNFEGFQGQFGKILEELFIPLMGSTKTYLRAAGYFSSSSIAATAVGWERLIENNGKIKLLISHHLQTEDDRNTLDQAATDYAKYTDKETKEFLEEVKTLIKDYNTKPTSKKYELVLLKILGDMIRAGTLEIKVALIVPPNSIKRSGDEVRGKYGLYHPKYMIFLDDNGNGIACTGSQNETLPAYFENVELIVTANNWNYMEKAYNRMKRDFMKQWSIDNDFFTDESGTTYLIVDFPFAVKNKLIEIAPKSDKERKKNSEDGKRYYKILNEKHIKKDTQEITIPTLKLRKHQKEAVDAWKENNYKGIINMATGTGKTFVALFGQKVIPKDIIHIIIVPGQDLATQWEIEIRIVFGSEVSLVRTTGEKSWHERVSRLVHNFEVNPKELFIITTTVLAKEPRFQELFNEIDDKYISIVIDEVHRIGAKESKKALVSFNNVQYKLGLSATPERGIWDDGDKAIKKYFEKDKDVFVYTLKDAIRDRQLADYNYYLHVAYFTDEEYETYVGLSRSMAILIDEVCKKYQLCDKYPVIKDRWFQVDRDSAKEYDNKMRRRIALIKEAQNKLVVLRDNILTSNKIGKKMFVYCNDKEHVETVRIVFTDKRIPTEKLQ